MPSWLITGASGYLGRFLSTAVNECRPSDVQILALGRSLPPGWPRDQFVEADLTCPSSVSEAIRAVAPTRVFHLAGQTPPADAHRFYQANTVATALLLDALRALRRCVRVVLAGSAAELGPVPEEFLPVDESYPCHPVGAYGLSKWLATAAGLSARPPLEVMAARIFNPIGPGTPPTQSLGRFAAQLARPSPLEMVVGNLDARRDFIDVRDVAEALIALADRGRAGLVYHVGTGRSRRVGDGLERLIALCGRPVRVTIDPGLAAHAGPGDSRAKIRRIVEHTGWRPRTSWEESLRDLWEEARRGRGSGCH